MYQTGMSGKYHTSLVHVTSGFRNCIMIVFTWVMERQSCKQRLIEVLDLFHCSENSSLTDGFTILITS